MKRTFINFGFLVLVAVLLSSCATKNTFHTFYKEHKKQSTVAIGGPAFLANLFIPKEDVKDLEGLFKKVRHYRVMVFSEDSRGIDKEFTRFVKGKKYDRILEIREGRDDVQFYLLKKKDMINEIVLKIKEEDSFVLIGLKTKLKESDLEEILNGSDDVSMN